MAVREILSQQAVTLEGARPIRKQSIRSSIPRICTGRALPAELTIRSPSPQRWMILGGMTGKRLECAHDHAAGEVERQPSSASLLKGIPAVVLRRNRIAAFAPACAEACRPIAAGVGR